MENINTNIRTAESSNNARQVGCVHCPHCKALSMKGPSQPSNMDSFKAFDNNDDSSKFASFDIGVAAKSKDISVTRRDESVRGKAVESIYNMPLNIVGSKPTAVPNNSLRSTSMNSREIAKSGDGNASAKYTFVDNKANVIYK